MRTEKSVCNMRCDNSECENNVCKELIVKISKASVLTK